VALLRRAGHAATGLVAGETSGARQGRQLWWPGAARHGVGDGGRGDDDGGQGGTAWRGRQQRGRAEEGGAGVKKEMA
jgi:hypothetical protein